MSDATWLTLDVYDDDALGDGRESPGSAPDAEAEAADRWDELGALIAERDDVGGVETVLFDEAPDAPADGRRIRIYATLEAEAELATEVVRLARTLGLRVRVASTRHEGDDFRDTWKKFYQPIVFGAGQLLLRPSWLDRRPDDPELEIVLDPGRAFGTGAHETTSLCLDVLCLEFSIQPPAGPYLDLGCGSGILALAIAKLGDAPVLAVDNDPEAVEVTLENTALNHLEAVVTARTSTLRDLSDELRFGLIVANIRTTVLVDLAPELARRLAPSGRLLLSGILTSEADEVQDAMRAEGLSSQRVATKGDWCLLRATRA